MLQKDLKNPVFTTEDQQLILQCLVNQPLQNMNAARAMDQLIGRFNVFCAKYASAPPKPAAPVAPPADAKPGKAKGK